MHQRLTQFYGNASPPLASIASHTRGLRHVNTSLSLCFPVLLITGEKLAQRGIITISCAHIYTCINILLSRVARSIEQLYSTRLFFFFLLLSSLVFLCPVAKTIYTTTSWWPRKNQIMKKKTNLFIKTFERKLLFCATMWIKKNQNMCFCIFIYF